MRHLSAFLIGGLFGVGLVVSGMTDTLKVQGWLDVFGDWDPTLAFVMGGAILPMALAWRLAARRKVSALGLALPGTPAREIGPDLVWGSVLFGAGWALAGLCPGPALASLGFGGLGGLVFLVAMCGGMMLARPLRARSPALSKGSQMDIRHLTPDYAVSPQITPEDLAILKGLGFTTVIDNRPDGEIPAEWSAEVMAAEAQAQGLAFVVNPIRPGDFSESVLAAQGAAIAEGGKVFAYCASGNRSSCAWAMSAPGALSTEERIAIPARFGYNLEPLRERIAALRG